LNDLIKESALNRYLFMNQNTLLTLFYCL